MSLSDDIISARYFHVIDLECSGTASMYSIDLEHCKVDDSCIV